MYKHVGDSQKHMNHCDQEKAKISAEATSKHEAGKLAKKDAAAIDAQAKLTTEEKPKIPAEANSKKEADKQAKKEAAALVEAGILEAVEKAKITGEAYKEACTCLL